MKTKAKIIIAAVLAIAISIGSIAIYKHITGPKEDAGRCSGADDTEDDHLGCIQEHKGRDPADQQEQISRTIQDDSDCGTGCTESCHKGDRRQDPDIYSALHGQ